MQRILESVSVLYRWVTMLPCTKSNTLSCKRGCFVFTESTTKMLSFNSLLDDICAFSNRKGQGSSKTLWYVKATYKYISKWYSCTFFLIFYPATFAVYGFYVKCSGIQEMFWLRQKYTLSISYFRKFQQRKTTLFSYSFVSLLHISDSVAELSFQLPFSPKIITKHLSFKVSTIEGRTGIAEMVWKVWWYSACLSRHKNLTPLDFYLCKRSLTLTFCL